MLLSEVGGELLRAGAVSHVPPDPIPMTKILTCSKGTILGSRNDNILLSFVTVSLGFRCVSENTPLWMESNSFAKLSVSD